MKIVREASNLTREIINMENMTDSQKLDLILEKVGDLEAEVKNLKRQQSKSTAELKAMDDMILDEVERIHEIMIKKTEALEKRIG